MYLLETRSGRTHEGGKVVSPKHRPPLHLQGIFLVLILLEAEANPGMIKSMKYSSDAIVRFNIPA